MKEMIDKFKAARSAKVPLIAIQTPDPATTINTIWDKREDTPVVQWDVIQGIRAVNGKAATWVIQIHTVAAPEGEKKIMPASMVTANPIEALNKCTSLPQNGIMFMHNAHLYLEKSAGDSFKPVIQAIWNLRDLFKSTGRTLVMLCPNIQVPQEINHDVLVIDEPLPVDKDLETVVTGSFKSHDLDKPDPELMTRIVYSIAGLATFNAEQTVSMSINKRLKEKVDMDEMWTKKIHIIERTSGLRIQEKGPCFANIGGNNNIKSFLTKIAEGERKPSLVVFIDEIEKALAAAGTDTSGTTTDQLKVLLTEMQNNDWTGMILYGFPGCGKSELSKAFGHEAGCITAEADLGAMKNKYVGSSEARMRSFIKTIKAIGGRHVFFMATCNQIELLRPELNRRFRKGIFFCDLPNKKEKDSIWKIYREKFGIAPKDPRPNDEGWSGAEIRACCDNAAELKIKLAEAAKYLTIVSTAMGPKVESMREAASGKYVNANAPGVYVYKRPFLQNLMKA